MAELLIVQLDASEMDNYSYLVYCPETLEGAAVDPSMRPELLLAEADRLGVRLSLLLNTHGHPDHSSGNATILARGGIKLAAHPAEPLKPDIKLEDRTRLALGNAEIEVLHTPGHTPGSLVFRTGNAAITGDTLFVSRCGRADLPGSNVEDLYHSLQRLKQLPQETIVYPGHNYGPTVTSTIGWELQHNEYLKCSDLPSFIKLRLG